MLKNTTQGIYNEIKGQLTELNKDIDWCSITIKVGHINHRNVNLVCKRNYFDQEISKTFKTGDNLSVSFYISSRKKHERWYTNATILTIEKF